MVVGSSGRGSGPLLAGSHTCPAFLACSCRQAVILVAVGQAWSPALEPQAVQTALRLRASSAVRDAGLRSVQA